MGLAVDTVVGVATNPGAAFTALTMNTGDSTTVRNFGGTDTAQLLGMIRQGATSGAFRVRSPLLHDDVRGIEIQTGDTPARRMLPRQVRQLLKPQDTLIAEITGGAAEVDLGALRIFYSNLPGASARLHMPGDIMGNVKNIMGVLVTCTTSATAGVWVDTAVNATEDLYKANQDYAVLGYMVDAAAAVVAIRGADTGNLRVGAPGNIDPLLTTEFFIDESEATGLPMIPVFNSANKSSTFVSVSDVATAATINVTLILAQLTTNLGA